MGVILPGVERDFPPVFSWDWDGKRLKFVMHFGNRRWAPGLMRHLAWETRSQRLTFSHYLGSTHILNAFGRIQMSHFNLDYFFLSMPTSNIYICVCMYACIYIYMYVCVCMYVCMYIYIYIYIYVCIYMYVFMNVNIYVYVCICILWRPLSLLPLIPLVLIVGVPDWLSLLIDH